jgi:hypothetical protein
MRTRREVLAMDVLRAIEDSGIGIWVRESGSLWSYPTIIFLHAVGLTFVAGVNAAVDLRLLGFAPRLPLASMRGLFPVMWVGFWINALSGIALLIADATTMMVSWVFWVKIAAIVLAVITLARIRHVLYFDPRSAVARGGNDSVPRRLKMLAAASLFLWFAAVTAGRLTAYLGAGAVAKGGR